MQSITYLTKDFTSSVIESKIHKTVVPVISSIDFDCQSQSFDSTHIYILEEKHFAEIMPKLQEELGLSFFVSCISKKIPAGLDKLQNNVFLVNLTPIEIYNFINPILAQQRSLYSQLIDNVHQNISAQVLLDFLAKKSKSSVALISANKKVNYFKNYGGNKFFQKNQVTNDEVNAYIADLINEDYVFESTVYKGTLPQDTNYRFCIAHNDKDPYIPYSISIYSKIDDSCDPVFITYALNNMVALLLNLNQSNADSSDFSFFVDDLLEGRLHSAEQIEMRESALANPLGKYLGFIIIYNRNLSRFSQQVKELKEILQCQNIATRGQYIVALKEYPNSKARLEKLIDMDAFHNHLTRWHSVAAVDYATSIREMLITRYKLTEETISLGMQMDKERKQRIYFFNEYSEFILLKLCSSGFRNLVGHENLIFLGHPAIVDLYSADPSGKKGYIEVLEAFLKANGNVEKTAKALFMHRNTVNRKMKKITEILDIDLSDGEICHKILFSINIQKLLSAQHINLEKMVVDNSLEEMKNIQIIPKKNEGVIQKKKIQ